MKQIQVNVYEDMAELVEAFKEGKLEGYKLVIEEHHCYLTGGQGAVLADSFEGGRETWKVVEAAFKLLGIPIHIT